MYVSLCSCFSLERELKSAFRVSLFASYLVIRNKSQTNLKQNRNEMQIRIQIHTRIMRRIYTTNTVNGRIITGLDRSLDTPESPITAIYFQEV